MVRMMVAAAIPQWSKVVIPTNGAHCEIEMVHNSTPRPGRIIWLCDDGNEYEMGGNQRIEVLELP